MRQTPLAVLANATAIGAEREHSLTVLADGTARAWGSNALGKLGDNTPTDRRVPVVVQDLGGAVTVSGGNSHSLSLNSSGSVWGWGDELNNTLLAMYVPYRIPGAGTMAIAAAVGGSHSAVAWRDGSVWTWGFNTSGQLGDGTTGSKSFPVQVPNFFNWGLSSAASTTRKGGSLVRNVYVQRGCPVRC